MMPSGDRRSTALAQATLPAVATSRESTYPHGYPNGWYLLAESDEVRRGQVIEIGALGRRFAVFRSDVDNSVGVLDAHCPHLGANLARGSVVDGCVKCPFHGWRFDCDGKVQSIPYTNKVSAGLRTRSHPAQEIDGQIFVWSAQHGRRTDEPPDYSIPATQGIPSGKMVYRGHYDAGIVRMHLCEFAENSADFQHFAPLHGNLRVPWTTLNIPHVGINHRADWRLDPAQPHMAFFDDEAMLTFRGRSLPSTAAHATIQFIGPGSVVRFHFQIPKVGDIIMYHTHTPTEPMAQRVRLRWYADRTVPRLLVSYVIGNWVAQWRADIDVWENKVYRAKPMLVAEDGPIHDLRRWFAQFYI